MRWWRRFAQKALSERRLDAEAQFPRGYDSAERKQAFFERTLARISALPGVTHAAVAFGLPPLGTPHSDDMTIPGKPHDKRWATGVDAVSESYFPTVGLQLLRGRLISASDVSSTRRVAVISSTLAKSFFAGENPLGQQIKFNVFDEEPQFPHDAYFEIVGVVSDLKGFDPHEPPPPQAYIPYTFIGPYNRAILVRTVTNPSMLVNALRKTIAEVDSRVVLTQPRTLDELLEREVYMRPKFRLISFGTCAGIGIGLALIGLFGVLSYSVSLQTHELGIRMALGAHGGKILALVLGKGLLLVGSGILLGFLSSFLTVRILQSQLWGISPFDPWTFVLAPIALLAAGFLACYLPARKATRVDPMTADFSSMDGRGKEAAHKIFSKEARQGNPAAMVNLAVTSLAGWNTKPNAGAALYWLHTASDRGFAPASYDLGILYFKGCGVRQDLAEALRFFRLGADSAYAPAQVNVGYFYDHGLGVAQDYAAAARWYLLAAESGEAQAQYNLADLYLHGEGVSKDEQKAFSWYEKAALEGHSGARIMAGSMLAVGRGTSKDLATAYLWTFAAVLQGDARGVPLLRTLERQLPGPEIEEAIERARLLVAEVEAAKNR